MKDQLSQRIGIVACHFGDPEPPGRATGPSHRDEPVPSRRAEPPAGTYGVPPGGTPGAGLFLAAGRVDSP